MIFSNSIHLSPTNKLDKVLKFMAKSDASATEVEIEYILSKINDNQNEASITGPELKKIINKLVYDRYLGLREVKKTINTIVGSGIIKDTEERVINSFYYITFEGFVFNQRGGYKKKHLKENFLIIVKIIEATVLVVVAIVSAWFAKQSYYETKRLDDQTIKEKSLDTTIVHQSKQLQKAEYQIKHLESELLKIKNTK